MSSFQEREDVLDPMMNQATADIKALLVKNYKSSEYRAKTKAKIYEIKNYVSFLIFLHVSIQFLICD